MRDSEETRQRIRENADEIVRLRARADAMYAQRATHGDEAWRDACDEFHARYDALAFPGGYDTDLFRRLDAGERNTVEAVLCFLEVRPYFFRSGYMWKELLRRAKRVPLDAQRAERLATVVRNYAEYRARRTPRA